MENIRAIHNEKDYEWAIAEITPYFENIPNLGTPEAERFDVLADLIKVYEDKNHVIPNADPVDVLNFAIEQMGHTQKELGDLIGRSRASEILSRKRTLTIEMIRTISAAWKLPADSLIGAYALEKAYA